jgi:DHA1 family tetracycline resistance protein-like MFS transporter
MGRKRITLLLGFVFVDLLGYSLFLPLLPYYATELGAAPVVVGLLVASNAAAQLIAAPLVGRLSDRFGRRPLLIFSIAGTLVSFLLLGFVEPLGALLADQIPGRVLGRNVSVTAAGAGLGVLFATRVLDGLAGGNVSLARAYVTDVTDEKGRAAGLGMIGAAFGMGFIVGPALGGALSNWGAAASAFATIGLSRFAVPAFAAAALTALNLLGVILLLPESLTAERRALIAGQPPAAFGARALWQALHRPRFGPLLYARLLYGLAFAVFQANFALYAQYRLGLTDRTTSYILSYVGILVVLVQGVAVGRLSARFRESRLVLAAAVLMALALLAWAFVPNVELLLVVMAPLALAGGVLNTVTNSLLSKSVYPAEVGGALGLSASLDSLTRVVAPLWGGFLLERLGASSLGLSSAALMAWAVAFVWRRLVVNPDPPLPARGGEGMQVEPVVK